MLIIVNIIFLYFYLMFMFYERVISEDLASTGRLAGLLRRWTPGQPKGNRLFLEQPSWAL